MDRTPFTEKPLVVLGATGRLASELVFYSLLKSFSRHIVLNGSSIQRLEGLRNEIDESSFGDLNIELTLSIEEAISRGGYIFFAKSVPGGSMTREEMLLENAPFAKEAGEALRKYRDRIERVVCVSNPSDLMGLTLLVLSGLPAEQVMSVSALDTMRLRRAIKRRYQVAEADIVEAYTLGSHDEKMAPMLDNIRIKGKSLKEMGVTEREREEIVDEVRRSGIMIYKQRGQTAYQSPAIQGLRMLMARDEKPFEVPTARYHHSDRYSYVYGSLPTRIDSNGCHHFPFCSSMDDLSRLDRAFGSIAKMRDILIREDILPQTSQWHEALQERRELICITE